MADTVRTKTDLIARFAANTTNNITSQEFRDLVSSIVPAHGTMYVSSSAATTVSVSSTYYKVAGTTTATNLHNFSMPANNRLQYDGTPDIHVHVAVTISCTTASNSQVTGWRVAKNGDATITDAVASTTRHKTGTGTDVVSTAVHFDSMMSNGDYLELWVTNETSATTVTADNAYFFVLGMMDQT